MNALRDDPHAETTINIGVEPSVKAHADACSPKCGGVGGLCAYPVPRCLSFDERLVLARRLDRYSREQEKNRLKPTHFTQVQRGPTTMDEVVAEESEREFERRVGFERGSR